MSRSLGVDLALTDADIARFHARVLRTASCWIWTASVGSDGYGRFSLRRPDGSERMVTPHQVAATLAFGQIPAGATLLHDCDVRLCCRTDPGHVRVGTQVENMVQAVARGRACGPRLGMVDVRGSAGASRAIQAALAEAVAAQQQDAAEALAAVLARAIAEGDPRADLIPLFELEAAAVAGGHPSRCGVGCPPRGATGVAGDASRARAG